MFQLFKPHFPLFFVIPYWYLIHKLYVYMRFRDIYLMQNQNCYHAITCSVLWLSLVIYWHDDFFDMWVLVTSLTFSNVMDPKSRYLQSVIWLRSSDDFISIKEIVFMKCSPKCIDAVFINFERNIVFVTVLMNI